MKGAEAYQRAVDLLEQAFETEVEPDGPWDGSGPPRLRSKMPGNEADRYIAAAQAYATLAQTAATIDVNSDRVRGHNTEWREVTS